MLALIFPTIASANGRCKSDLSTQVCAEVGSGIVRCTGKREMCIPGNGTVLHIRSLEIRTEPLETDPSIIVEIKSKGLRFIPIRSSNQGVNDGQQTQIVIDAQSLKSTGSDDYVTCNYVITGKRKSSSK